MPKMTRTAKNTKDTKENRPVNPADERRSSETIIVVELGRTFLSCDGSNQAAEQTTFITLFVRFFGPRKTPSSDMATSAVTGLPPQKVATILWPPASSVSRSVHSVIHA